MKHGLRRPNGPWGSYVMSEGMLSYGPLRWPSASGAHSVRDPFEAAFCAVKKMYNKQASIKMVTAMTL